MCLVLIGAGFGLWKLADSSGGRTQLVELPEQVESPMMSGDVRQLQRFTIEQPRYGSLIRLELQGDDWMITEPIVDFPEPMAISFTLRTLYGDDWQAAPPQWAEQSSADLGLDPAAATFELRYEDGTSEILRIGAAEETGRWRVAERNGELFRFPISPFRQLAQPSELWRDHRMQPFGVNVSRLVWTPIDGEVIEVVQERNKWYLRRPFAAPLSDTAFDHLMQLLGWRVDSLASLHKDDVTFLKPLGTLVLEQGREKVTLEVNGDGIVSDRRDYPISYSARAFRFLSLSVEELRSPRIFELNADQISSIKVEYGEDSRLYRLSDGEWKETSAEAVVAEESAFVKALLEHGSLLERGEEVALPEGPPSGRVLFSISRTPKEKGSIVLRWWVDEQGRNIVAPTPSTNASISSVNFELGVRSLFGL